MRYVIDTHALIWFLEKNPRLGAQATSILSDPESSLVLPAIALAESVWIVERGRTSIPSAQMLLDAVIADPRITIYALDQSVLEQTLNLSAISEMHDRQIVATAIVLQN
jgi:PIN domain nuclease of toxin-antitoxin system